MDSPNVTKTLSEAWQQRFGGIARLYGSDALPLLATMRCAVVGVGGVGTWVAEALARTGVGHVTLVDLDDVCVTNTNRQIHALTENVGKSKTDVMAQRLLSINPEIDVKPLATFITPETVAEKLSHDLHVVIDACDSASAKSAMISWCKRQKIIVITVGSAGGKSDPRAITSADLSRTKNDALLAKVRNQLRRHYGFTRTEKKRFDIEAVYSEEQSVFPQPDGQVCANKSVMQDGVKLDCSGGFGSATMVTATFGMVAAARAVDKYLLRMQRQKDA